MEVNPELLHSLYWGEGLPVAGVASRIGTSEEAARKLMIKHNVPRKPKTWKCAGANAGKAMSDEQRRLLSEKRKAMYASGELAHWNAGRHWPDAIRRKISASLLSGRDPSPSSYGPEFRFQRTSCLQRDNYTCQQCGSTERLEVHHWEPYRFSFDNSLENLVTLCADCHDAIHAAYRREGFIAEAEGAMYA